MNDPGDPSTVLLPSLTPRSLKIGASVGVYAWSGTDYRRANQDQSTTQGFVTYGLLLVDTDRTHLLY